VATVHRIRGRAYRSLDDVRDRLGELNAAADGRRFTDAEREEWDALQEVAEALELDLRRDRILDLDRRGSGERVDVDQRDPDRRPSAEQAGPERSAALRTIEGFTRDDTLTPTAADRLDGLVRAEGHHGSLAARYLDAVADPAYFTAFGKALQDPATAPLRMSPDEQVAWSRGRPAADAPHLRRRPRPER
jgi:hypothetical protein